MPFKWLTDLQDQAKSQWSKFNNATFKNAAMATCALIAAADGEIEAAEKTKVAKLIAGNEMLQVFGAVELRDLFLAYADKAGDEFARLDLIAIVSKLKGNAEQSATCLKIALIIANADGEFEESEKKVVTELCKTLSVPVADYVS